MAGRQCDGTDTIYRRLYRAYFQPMTDNVSVFSKTSNFTNSCGSCISHPESITSILFRKFVPRVHAMETSEIDGNEELTLSERVAANIPKVHVSDAEVEQYLENETGMDRLRQMYSRQGTDDVSADLMLVVGVTQNCAIITFVYKSFIGAMECKQRFITDNQHTKFKTKFRAKRIYNDSIILGGVKHGAPWAFKCAMFTLLFMGTSQSLAVYENKTKVSHYVAAAALTGAVLKVNLGLKGFIAGGIIGSVFGLFGGALMWGTMTYSNERQEQRHYNYVHNILREKREIACLQNAVKGLESLTTEPQITPTVPS